MTRRPKQPTTTQHSSWSVYHIKGTPTVLVGIIDNAPGAETAIDRVDRILIETVDPWHSCPIVETQHELGLKNYSPRPTRHNPHKIRAICRRHEIDKHR